MHDIRDQDHRDCQICDQAVCLLYKGQETELCDAKIYDAAYKRRKDLFLSDLQLRCLCFCFLTADPRYHGCDHIHRGRHCAEDDKQGDQGRHKRCAHAFLDHQKCRHAGVRHPRICIYCHQTQHDHHHHQRVHDHSRAHALCGIRRLLKGSRMLDKYGNVRQLECPVQECRIQSAASRKLRCRHLFRRFCDISHSRGNIGDINDQQSGDNADRQDRSNFPHQIRPEYSYNEYEHADQERTEQVRKSGQRTQRGASCGKSDCRRHAHHTDIQDFKQVGKYRCKSSVKGVVIRTVIIYLVLSCKTEAVCKKYSIVQHCQDRHDQACGAISHEITVDLGSGGKPAAKMRREPYKRHPQNDRCIPILLHPHFFSPFLSVCPWRQPASLLLLCMDNALHPTYPGCASYILPTVHP